MKRRRFTVFSQVIGLTVPQRTVKRISWVGIAALCCWSTAKANELDMLPQAPSVTLPAPPDAATNSVATTNQVLIRSVIPPYVDQGVTMLPLRPLCEFLGAAVSYHDEIITISRRIPSATGDGTALVTITLRAGGETAQIQNGSELKTVRLPLPADERLGTTFLPVRFFAETFGAEITAGAGQATLIKFDGRTGVLQASAQPLYRGRDAARVTIVNHVGRALSLRLTGPQNLAIELGRRQSVTRTLPPGVYYYRAASTGMKTVTGVRRLTAGRKATWAWGRR